MSQTSETAAGVERLSSPRGTGILAAVVAGSSLVGLDSTVVSVALPALSADLGADLAGSQWVLTSYLVSLSSLLLFAGALGDRYGRRRIFNIGAIWFGIASALTGLAPNIDVVILGRAMQGVGGALLTAGSLALLQASIHPDDRGRAIGIWSGLGGASAAVGVVLGGYLIDTISWRWVFLLNVPIAAIAFALTRRYVPESMNLHARSNRFDPVGPTGLAVGLGAGTYVVIGSPDGGLGPHLASTASMLSVAGLLLFALMQKRAPVPLVPGQMFRSRQFVGANLATALGYFGLGGFAFLFIVQLQTTLGYSALQAGAAMLPLTLAMLVFSPAMGSVATRIGPRWPMTVGPLLMAAAMLLAGDIDQDATYTTNILPAMTVLGLGLAATVTPLTATALGSVAQSHSGAASGANSTIARIAQLGAIALLPRVVGLDSDALSDPTALTRGYQNAALVCAAIFVTTSAVSWALIADPGDT